MKKKIFIVISLAFALLMVFTTAASAFAPYETYSYDITGEIMPSPSAYEVAEGGVHTAVTMSQNGKEEISITGDSNSRFVDFCTDSRGWIYISDAGQKRIIVLNQNFKSQYIIQEFDSEMKPMDTFGATAGIFVSDNLLYVCDTAKNRIVVFDTENNGAYVQDIGRPESKVFTESFTPIAVAVDRFGKLFVVSESSKKGVIVMDHDSVFSGYIGAQKKVTNAFDEFFERFDGDKKKIDVDGVLNPRNITLEKGDFGDFIYVVFDNLNAGQQQAAINSKSADASPVRKLNSKGDEIMKRNGFFDCGGEVKLSGGEYVVVKNDKISAGSAVSRIVDVACGPASARSWSIIDKNRRKIYTYDKQGQLLFVFGDTSGSDDAQMGQIGDIVAIEYQYDALSDTYNLLILDEADGGSITVFSCTEYGELLLNALESDNDLKYEESAENWKRILEANNNFDVAYIGYGRALYNQGKFDEALKYLAAAKETEVYSQTMKEKSRQNMNGNALIPILIVVAALVGIFIVVKIFGYAKRVNYEGNFKKKHSYWEELIYAFYVIFHPFDGFWDIKHENRGTVRGGLTILGINILAFYYQNIGRSYLANPTEQYSPFFAQVAAVTVPVILWAVANWCLTTLFDGEAKFKHVFVSSCYALAPLPVFVVAGTIITNLSNTVGDSIVTLVTTIGYVWVAFLLFFGTLVIQDYSLGKNVVTTIGTIMSMAIIMFVVILFASLVGDMVGFVSGLVTELSYR